MVTGRMTGDAELPAITLGAFGFFVWVRERIGAVGKWETCFWFSTFPSAFAVGLCGMWESRSDFQGLWESGVCFPSVRHFHRQGFYSAADSVFAFLACSTR